MADDKLSYSGVKRMRTRKNEEKSIEWQMKATPEQLEKYYRNVEKNSHKEFE